MRFDPLDPHWWRAGTTLNWWEPAFLDDERPAWMPGRDEALGYLAANLQRTLAAVAVASSYRTLTTGQASRLASRLPARARHRLWLSLFGAGVMDLGFPVAVSARQAISPYHAPFTAIRLPLHTDVTPILADLGATPAELVSLAPPRRSGEWRPLLRGTRQFDRHNLIAAAVAVDGRERGFLTAGEAWGRFDLLCDDPLMGEGGPDAELFGEDGVICVELTASTNQGLADKFARWDRVLEHPGCERVDVLWLAAGRDSRGDADIMVRLRAMADGRPRNHCATASGWLAGEPAEDGWRPQAGSPPPFDHSWAHADMGRIAAMVGLPGGSRWRLPARLDPPLAF